MSLQHTLAKTLPTLNTTLNRYQLNIPSCSSALDVESFNGLEALSQPYSYTISFTSPNKDIPADQLLRQPATLIMSMGLLQNLIPQKVVHGVITLVERHSSSADQTLYSITLQPKVALLDKQFRSHRFFVDISVPEVVEQVLKEHGFQGWEYAFTLKNTYPKREQINQYQESDLTFIKRLLAEVGIFFFFTLQPDTQTEIICFADNQSAFKQGPSLPLNSPSGMSDSGTTSVWGLELRHHVVEARVTTKDYNHQAAQNLLQSASADMTRGAGENLNYGEVYHYRARHKEVGDKINPAPETANFYARLDHERFLSDKLHISGQSTDATLAPAQIIKVIDGLQPTLPLECQGMLLLTALTFTASRQAAMSVEFISIPYSDTVCWRPPLLKRPRVAGTLTARITSARDYDLYAWQDDAGMYRVKFDADLDDKKQGQESMTVRLAKPYGGDTYGFHFPLIQGTEVAIAFHEGDPDRPYIAHALHDSRHPDHVTDKNSTRNVIRTPANNKLRMEDKRGEEHVKLSTEFAGKSQLNLGHNVDAGRELRGEGAELRTDKWVAVRGGAGVFITADQQPSASGKMLDMQAAQAQLQQALSMAEALRSAAETAKAELADLQIQKSLLEDSLKELKQSALLLSAPAGIAHSTPRSLQLSAGENIIANSGQQMDISVLKKFTLAAGELISLFAQKAGIKLFAGKGKVEIQAQGDEMALEALKDMRISSSEGKVVIRADQEILLVGSGGAYIRIGNGEVESGAPDKIIQRAAVWQKFSGQSASEMAQKWDNAGYSVTPVVFWKETGEPARNQKILMTRDDGTVQEVMTDGEGQLAKQAASFIEKIDIDKSTR
ncbi:type VI secretion system tip protein VgrG [Enterobacteriaceae bacterium 4M9]|nr:type VI secretion system tip protein VgrG [Enterobacteriaceae bacterium 4M9]